MQVSLLDLNAQFSSIKEEVTQSIHSVLDSQHFIMGSVVKDFEEEVCNYIGANQAFGCASGSDALLLALMAIDIKPGDYVITSPFTFFATAGAISRLGAIPIFIDIEMESYNLDPVKVRDFLEGKDELSKRLSLKKEQIKAIIPVHLYGQMADMHPIMEIAEEFGLYVIEDAAQGIGSKYENQQAGTIGDFGCFSFFPSKNLGAYGDAGLITVKDDELAEKVDILRLHGARPKYHHKLVGINSRLDSIQAAVLSVKLRYLEEWSTKRRALALRYNDLFEKKGLSSSSSNVQLILPKETTGAPQNNGRHIYHQYTLLSRRRDELQKFLDENGVGTAIYYPVPLHIQECFSDLGYVESDCPNSILASKQAISLPIYPELASEEVEYVVETIAKFFVR